MKKYSVNFNKRSRLHKIPEISDDTASQPQLGPLDAAGLSQKLSDTLQVQNDFFPCFDWTFPPPLISTSSAPTNAEKLFSKPSIIPNKYSLYLHSPFCKTLCSFCYYSILPGNGINESAKYVDHLIKEMEMYAERMKGSVCESIYFGGGTPTYLDDGLLIKIFNAIYDNFNMEKGAEISIEAAPGTLPIDKIALLKVLGVNRLSYGIQTLDEELLKGLNRNYSVDEAIEELSNTLTIIGNINVDTMYGFDNEPDDALIKTLDKFHQLGVPSLSIYSLDKQRSDHASKTLPPKDNKYEKKIAQFKQAYDFLSDRNYHQVLQNVFANPETGSYIHQVRRWDNLTLLALGMSAQGYAPKTSYQNISNLNGYYKNIDEGKLPIASVDHLSPEMEMCRELTSKLRFTAVNTQLLSSKYGIDLFDVFGDLIHSLVELGYLENKNHTIRMTSKSAYYNNIIPMLFSPDSFKEALLGLPEEYLEEFPVPYVMTKVGSVQSSPINIDDKVAEIFRFNRRKKTDRRDDKQDNGGDERRSNDRRYCRTSTTQETLMRLSY